jgi:hypothetical protein
METYHEGAYRCSRVGHADCCPDAPSERGPNVPGEFLIRVERLLTDDKPDQRPKVSGRAYRHEPASSVTDRIDDGFQPDELVPAAFRDNGCMRIFQTRRPTMNFLCRLLIWSFLCCLLATRVQAQETERGGGI